MCISLQTGTERNDTRSGRKRSRAYRAINLGIDEATLATRRAEQDAKGCKPAEQRKRKVTKASNVYAAFATGAAKAAAGGRASGALEPRLAGRGMAAVTQRSVSAFSLCLKSRFRNS
jgi:hypothetical protein